MTGVHNPADLVGVLTAIETNRILLAVIQATTADTNADLEIVDANVDTINDATQHVTSIFPSDTNLTCTFMAHANANTWSAWTEVQDSGATKLSDACAVDPMHITAMGIETLSEADAVYMIEIAWGDAKTLITSGRFAGATKFQTPTEHLRFWAPDVPIGELIYYRMKTDTAVADTAVIHFRYHCD